MTPVADAYIETSSINEVLTQGTDGESITRSIRSLGYRPAIGIHTIYELARTFLDPKQHSRGRALFLVLRDIDGTIVPTTGQLIENELIKLRTGAEVLPFLDHDNQIATRYEIERLAQGFLDRATQFIEAREKERRTIEPLENNQYLQQILEINRIDPDRFNGIKTFDHALKHFNGDVPAIIMNVVKRGVSKFEATEISERLDSFPCIRSLVRANIYLCFIMIRNQVDPSYDRVDDFRQVADASYCDAFITNDEQLARTASHVNARVRVVRWREIP